jgi:predicted MPP superfamily phosphohydrolase
MRLAWLTDIHLNFVSAERRRRLLNTIARQADAVAISGDIGESPNVGHFLQEMAHALGRQVFFVLGNHDFYRGSIARTREAMARLAGESEHLVYLTAVGVVELTPDTALVGHDGWADARLGDFQRSDVVLNDYLLIDELRWWKEDFVLDKERLRPVLENLGDEAARHFERRIAEAASRYSRVIAVTHIPPFHEATWHAGRWSDDNWMPHFSCQAAGQAMLRAMRLYPASNLLVLCGHTHGSGQADPADNVRVLTGAAEYGRPEIQQIIDV